MAHHGAKGNSGQRMVVDGHKVQQETNAETQEGEERCRQQHRLHPVLSCKTDTKAASENEFYDSKIQNMVFFSVFCYLPWNFLYESFQLQ